MKKIWWLLCLLVLVGCRQQSTASSPVEVGDQTSGTTEVIEPTYQFSKTPTLFVHGYQGGRLSFGGMLRRLEREGITNKEMVLSVDTEGNVSAKGELSGKTDNPTIQVLFEDNQSHEWNQALWIKNCLAYLHDTYQVKEVNLVGHSMGGVSALRYLLTYTQDNQLPNVSKFIAIGAPFNNFAELNEGETLESVLANGPVNKSDRYADFETMLSQEPQQVQALLIAGDVSDGTQSDGTVSVSDALSVVALLSNQFSNISYQIIEGTNAQHSQLHENQDVDQMVLDFLYK
ncbi:alpha/beta fold hydrolase [Vagococcus xieshaowenii]|uniref:Alpha/beta fold hydrolase n=1 Tax=Vagococcus xieshaowenii TaxID=2562451 RepID=A0AAJ5EFQ7_9ENTE|nr:alpha/beta fold hydrolase [Vagococcus xieshaowenii]QCA29414.1 alpha/beta fold hydrolase [Vagococcus xieshaowenii]TFZ41535.1 alpha/beta fold hydrolase [Vagococcus xieshaowenii]